MYERNSSCQQEKQYKAELEMELKKDECSRMQKQLKSYAGLLSSLEAEFMKTRQAFADAKTMVSENCRLGEDWDNSPLRMPDDRFFHM